MGFLVISAWEFLSQPLEGEHFVVNENEDGRVYVKEQETNNV